MNRTELALQKIDEIIALLKDSDNPLDQLILMAALTTKGSVSNYDAATLLREVLSDHHRFNQKVKEAAKLVKASNVDTSDLTLEDIELFANFRSEDRRKSSEELAAEWIDWLQNNPTESPQT